MAPEPAASTTPTADRADAGTTWLTDGEQRLWRHYLGATRRLFDHLEADLKAHGVTHDDYGVLVWLSEAEGGQLRMSELAERVVVSRSRLSHHVGRLERRGLVTRTSCPDDRRGSFAVLSPAGRALMEATAPHHVAGVRAWFIDHVEPEEQAVLQAVFARIDRALASACRAVAADGDDG
jgi:DNA-binding MarR family transcriptional regulator